MENPHAFQLNIRCLVGSFCGLHFDLGCFPEKIYYTNGWSERLSSNKAVLARRDRRENGKGLNFVGEGDGCSCSFFFFLSIFFTVAHKILYET